VNQKGIAPIILLIGVAMLAVILGGYIWNQHLKVNTLPQVNSEPSPTNNTVTNSWQTYTDNKISFQYPLNWKVVKANDDSGLELYNPDLALGIWKHDNPTNLSLKAYSDKKHQEIIAGGYGAPSPPLFSDKGLRVQLPNGASAQYEKEFFCEPTICHRYVIKQPLLFYEIIVFQAMKQEDLNQILSSFKFTDQGQSPTVAKDDHLFTISTELAMQLPKTATVIDHLVTINNSTYQVYSGEGMGGPCPMDATSDECGWTDTSLPHMTLFRTWKDKSGIFMLNPQEIKIDGYYANHITISKTSPNKYFTNDEVNLWKTILKDIKPL
jgi:hypothetical protein